MLVIRFQRVGKKHQPSYRLVVAEARSKVGAPPTEDVGSYDPFSKKATIKGERVNYWITMGAQPSATVWNLLVREKIVSGPTRAIKMSKKKSAEEATKPVSADSASVATLGSPEPSAERGSAKGAATAGKPAAAEAKPVA